MNIPFILPDHDDWAKVKFEFPKNMKITDLVFYENDGMMCVDIPLYVIDSNQPRLISNYTIWTRCDRGIVSTLYNLFKNYANLPNRVFKLTRLGYNGDPKTEYIIELIE